MLFVAGPITNVITQEETSSIDNSSRSAISVVGSANYGSSTARQGHTNTLFVDDVSKLSKKSQTFFLNVRNNIKPVCFTKPGRMVRFLEELISELLNYNTPGDFLI